jgi:transcriptional regulator with XRE-family HTH domain
MRVNVKQGVAQRIIELASEYGFTINGLAKKSKLPQSSLYSILNSKSQNPGVETLQKICNGLGISIREFFNSSIFEEEKCDGSIVYTRQSRT